MHLLKPFGFDYAASEKSEAVFFAFALNCLWIATIWVVLLAQQVTQGFWPGITQHRFDSTEELKKGKAKKNIERFYPE